MSLDKNINFAIFWYEIFYDYSQHFYAFYEILLIYIQMVRLKYTKICASCQPAVHKLTFVHSVHLVHRGADLDD